MRLPIAAGALALLCASVASAHHPSGGSSSNGGQHTMNAEGPLAGQVYLGTRVEAMRFRDISSRKLREEAAEGSGLHGIHSHYGVSLEGDVGLSDWLSAGGSATYYVTNNLRSVHGGAAHGGGGGHSLLADPLIIVSHHTAGPVATSELQESQADVEGFGDVLLWAQATVRAGDFRFGFKAGFDVPVGETDERDDDGERVDMSHQPGSGSWDVIGGVAVTYVQEAWSAGVAVTGRVNTRGRRNYEIGDAVMASAGGAYDLAPHHAGWTLAPTLDIWAEWHGRDQDGRDRLEDSGGWLGYAAPGLRFSVGVFSIQASMPIQLYNGIDDEPNEKLRGQLSCGVSF